MLLIFYFNISVAFFHIMRGILIFTIIPLTHRLFFFFFPSCASLTLSHPFPYSQIRIRIRQYYAVARDTTLA